MPKIIRTPLAKLDAAHAWCYIAERNLSAADSMIDRFDARLRQLAEFPETGESVPKHGLRRAVVDPYVIYYRPIKNGIEIIRILHTAQRHEDLL